MAYKNHPGSACLPYSIERTSRLIAELGPVTVIKLIIYWFVPEFNIAYF